MAMSSEHRSKFAALHRQWWRLQMREKFSSGTKNPKTNNKKQTKVVVAVHRPILSFFSFYRLQDVKHKKVTLSLTNITISIPWGYNSPVSPTNHCSYKLPHFWLAGNRFMLFILSLWMPYSFHNYLSSIELIHKQNNFRLKLSEKVSKMLSSTIIIMLLRIMNNLKINFEYWYMKENK